MSGSTSHQRLFIRSLMRQQELPTQQITLLHRRLFKRAHLAEPTTGTDLDSHLCAMTRAEAGRLIDALRADDAAPQRERIGERVFRERAR